MSEEALALLLLLYVPSALGCIYLSWRISRLQGSSEIFGIGMGIVLALLGFFFAPLILYFLYLILRKKSNVEKDNQKISFEETTPKSDHIFSSDTQEKIVEEKSTNKDISLTIQKQDEQNQLTIGSNNIFISYRRSDSPDISGRIYDRLEQHFGSEKIFKDVDSIPLGVDFKEHLDTIVAKCEILLAVIGKEWLEIESRDGRKRLGDPRDFVRIEIESALKRNIPVIPLLVQGAEIPSVDELPSVIKNLSYRNGIPIRPDPDFHKDMDRLITGLEKILKS